MSDFHSCPCCGYPTLPERGAFEICTICWWEDDGTDDPATTSQNGHYTLARARENYADHFDMYDTGKGIGVVANPSSERKTLLAYLKAIREGDRPYDIRRLHSLLRGLSHG